MKVEWVDCLDSKGRPTGQTKLRCDVHRDGTWHKSVHVWIVSEQHELLLQQRSFQKDSHPGMWDVSCAGHVSSGETAIEAAMKELKEELGLVPKICDLQWIFVGTYQSLENKGTYCDNEWQDVFVWKKFKKDMPFVLQETEVAAVKWVCVQEFAKNYVRWVAERQLVDHHKEYAHLLEVLSVKS